MVTDVDLAESHDKEAINEKVVMDAKVDQEKPITAPNINDEIPVTPPSSSRPPKPITAPNINDEMLINSIKANLAKATGYSPSGYTTNWNGITAPEKFLFRTEGDSVSIFAVVNGKLYKILTGIRDIRQFRSMQSTDWFNAISFENMDGICHSVNIPLNEIHSTGWLNQMRRLGNGIRPKYEKLLTTFISNLRFSKRCRSVSSTGWYEVDGSNLFILPDKAQTSKIGGEEIMLFPAPPKKIYQQAGTLDAWRKMVGDTKGNSRLILAACCALAGPLLYLTGESSGGFHIYGRSSQGKSTALNLATSVWGSPVSFGNTWRGTDNSFEHIAALHNDSLLVLDEIGQASSRTVAEAAYMLANGKGKNRCTPAAKLMTTPEWRLMVLSSGELTIRQKLEEENLTAHAGQEVRLLDIPLPESGYGLFEAIPEGMNPSDFAERLNAITRTNYGHAGPLFVDALLSGSGLETLSNDVREYSNRYAPESSDGIERRAARRFALCELAGRLACKYDILPLDENDIADGIQQCFNDWLMNRPHSKPEPCQIDIVDHMKKLLKRAYLTGKFVSRSQPDGFTPSKHIGFLDNRSTATIFYISNEVFQSVIGSTQQLTAKKELARKGMLVTNDNSSFMYRMNIGNQPVTRWVALQINNDELEGAENNDME